jgi:hypothetical protein
VRDHPSVRPPTLLTPRYSDIRQPLAHRLRQNPRSFQILHRNPRALRQRPILFAIQHARPPPVSKRHVLRQRARAARARDKAPRYQARAGDSRMVHGRRTDVSVGNTISRVHGLARAFLRRGEDVTAQPSLPRGRKVHSVRRDRYIVCRSLQTHVSRPFAVLVAFIYSLATRDGTESARPCVRGLGLQPGVLQRALV